MKTLRKLLAIAAVGIGMISLSTPAGALTITYDDIISGYVPNSPAPWLTATITNTAGGVNITLTPTVLTPEFITRVYFSLNTTSFTIGDIVSDPDIDVLTCHGSDPGGAGPWQMCVAFDSSDHAQFPDSVTFFVAGLTEGSFVYNANGWLSAAHVQGIQPTCSGWVGAYDGEGPVSPSSSGVCGSTSVPEPGSLSLLGLGLAGLGFSLRRRKR